jgi:hypothetical protein
MPKFRARNVVECAAKVPKYDAAQARELDLDLKRRQTGLVSERESPRTFDAWAVLTAVKNGGTGTLADAVAVFRESPRTCEYFYAIADGKTGEAVGMEAGADVFHTVAMGEGGGAAAACRRGRGAALGRGPL